MFSRSPHEGRPARPPYSPVPPPEPAKATWAPQDPARSRAAEEEKGRRRRNSAETSSLDAGQLGLAYLRYNIGGRIAGAGSMYRELGATLTHLAHCLELSGAQTVGTAPRFEGAQRSAWAHVAHSRGTL